MFQENDFEKILKSLVPEKNKKLILDTDTYNEVDDQFAVSYAALAPDIDLLALTAAPFLNPRSKTPEDGMEQSYNVLLQLYKSLDPEGKKQIPICRGSKDYLKNTITPQPSEAADTIVRIVRESKDTVFIAGIGCFTNIASAILMDPSIIEKAVVVLVGAQPIEHGNANEFNLQQDRNAARVIFECGIPVIILPANGGTEYLRTTNTEIEYFLRGKAGETGELLLKYYAEEEGLPLENGVPNSRERIIWDIASIAFLRDAIRMCSIKITPSYTIDARGVWREIQDGRKLMFGLGFRRNEVFSDMFDLFRKTEGKI